MTDVDAIACKKGFTFTLQWGLCNHCTVNKLRALLGHCVVEPDSRNGVLAVVRGTPYLWFPDLACDAVNSSAHSVLSLQCAAGT